MSLQFSELSLYPCGLRAGQVNEVESGERARDEHSAALCAVHCARAALDAHAQHRVRTRAALVQRRRARLHHRLKLYDVL